MKKILTLLMAVTAFVSVQAQSREETRRVILGGGGNDNGTYGGRDRDVILGGGNNGSQYPNYPNNGGYNNDRQYQIDQINREYDAKIYSIRNNGYLSQAEKDRAIRQLERDRQQRLAEIDRRYKDGRYDDERYDNGKHKGWYKKSKNKNWKKGKGDRD